MFGKNTKINRRDFFILLGFFLPLSVFTFLWNDSVDEILVDVLFQVRGERQLTEHILYVHISDADIRAVGGWPFTRDFYGYMTYALHQLKAKVIAFDLLFDQPDRIYPEYDRILSDFFESSGNIALQVVFGDFAQHTTKISGHSLVAGQDLQAQAQMFQKHAAGIGFSNLGESAMLRTIPIVAAYGDSTILAFGAELARLFLGCSKEIELQQNALILRRKDRRAMRIPFGKKAQLRLNHFGSLEKTNHIAFLDLLRAFENNPDSLRQHIENKLVIIAASSPSLPVLKATPYSNVFPAALIHATLAENIILGNYLREAPPFARIALILMMLITPVFILRNGYTKFRFFSLGLVLFGYWIAAILFFSFLNFVLPLFYPTFALLLSASFLLVRSNVLHRQKMASEKAALKDQVKNKISALADTEARLAEIQRKLQTAQSEKAAISEESRKLARERQEALEALDRQLRDMQVHEKPFEAYEAQFREIVHAPRSAMAPVLEMVQKVAKENIPVLILGETGTGKELVARAIHSSSPRSNKEFVAVNCGALPENLLESELFGHEKGSFTGAHSRRRGRFELANGGTIFLDEITETTPAFQVKLLRVLQEGTLERLGGEQTQAVDVRVICACNMDFKSAVESGSFRADLYYRLNGFPIEIPPLRQRPDDIPPLAGHFLAKYGYTGKLSFSDQAMAELRQFTWPGNVRELENSVRRAAILAQSENRKLIRMKDLPAEIRENKNIAEQNAEYMSFEEQILHSLRALKFSSSAISQTAKALGNRDRGTITEYFRGICFEALVKTNYSISEATKQVAGTEEDEEILARVRKKMREYLNSVRTASSGEEGNTGEDLKKSSLFKGLPRQYHGSLLHVIENMDKIV